MTERDVFADPTELRHRIGPEGTLSLQCVSGSVELAAADGDEVRLIARSQGGRRDELPLVVRRTDGALHVEVDQRSFGLLGGGFMRGRGAIEFEVTAPRGARLDVNTVSSDIEARGFSGEQRYRTVSGDVEIAGDGGRVAVTTVSGDIELSAAGMVRVSLASTSGDVELDAREIESLEVRTVSGDVQVSGNLSTAETHSVETVSGDLAIATPTGVTIDVKRGLDIAGGGGRRLVAGDGSAQLRFRSLSGDVELAGPRGRRTVEVEQPRPEPPAAQDALGVLRALERGEIDVDEASRRLEGARTDG